VPQQFVMILINVLWQHNYNIVGYIKVTKRCVHVRHKLKIFNI